MFIFRIKPLRIAALVFITTLAHAEGPLPSWGDAASKQVITAFVSKVTTEEPPFQPTQIQQ